MTVNHHSRPRTSSDLESPMSKPENTTAISAWQASCEVIPRHDVTAILLVDVEEAERRFLTDPYDLRRFQWFCAEFAFLTLYASGWRNLQ